MKRIVSAFFIAYLFMLTGCSVSRSSYNPFKRYPVSELQEDYTLFRNILEESHPSVYWYTSKDSMDYYFDQGYANIKDSMTEPQFRTLLSYVISKVNCGHTVVKYSKKFSRFLDTARIPNFPLSIKFWDDTAAVYANLNRRDSALIRGTVLQKINGLPMNVIRDSLFQFLSTDGYSITHKYQSLSNLGNFSGWYRNVFGLRRQYNIEYLDTNGVAKTTVMNTFEPRRDTSLRRRVMEMPPKRMTRKERRLNRLAASRNIQVDTTMGAAYMTINSFSTGNKLRSFYRSSFSVMKKNNVKHLVVDVRSNGGGNVSNSNLLTKYLSDHKFKLADSLYAVRRLSKYEKHIKNSLITAFFMLFVTKKKSDGNFHFGFFERHYYKPKKKNHYDGNLYILTGGNSFSATTLFINSIRQQPNVKVIGEETGGGSYGNSAWFIPDARLPNTHLTFRLPRFRLVMNKNFPKTGHGIIPDIEVKPTLEAIRKGYDVKSEFVRKMIYGN